MTSPGSDPGTAPEILSLPIGLRATGTRREFDSLGEVDVPAGRYWGAQTQRSLEHFSIGEDKMPKAVYHAYGYVKKAAAIINTRAGGSRPGWDSSSGRCATRSSAERSIPSSRCTSGRPAQAPSPT